MSFSAEAEKQRQAVDVVEGSDGMTLLNVIAVGSTGFFIGTPEKATATLGTALRGLEVRVGKNVEWAEARAWRQQQGRGSKGRNRGKGARLRRQKKRQQQVFRRWQDKALDVTLDLRRRLVEDGKEQPADTPSATGTHGLGNARSQRLLCQLGEAKQELKKEVRLRAIAEEGLKKAEERNESLLKAYSWDAQGDLRKAKEETARVVLQKQELIHKLKVRKRDLEEAHQYEGRQEVRIAELQQQLEEVRAGVEAAAGQQMAGGQERQVTSPRAGCATEETPDTVRKPRLSSRSPPPPPPTVYMEGPETYMGTVVSVPDVARNPDGTFRLRVQMPKPAMVDFQVKADIATGSRLKISVSSRIYAVERQ